MAVTGARAIPEQIAVERALLRGLADGAAAFDRVNRWHGGRFAIVLAPGGGVYGLADGARHVELRLAGEHLELVADGARHVIVVHAGTGRFGLASVPATARERVRLATDLDVGAYVLAIASQWAHGR